MIIVTGGAGFIGSNLVKALNKRDIKDIIIADELGCDERWKNLRDLKYRDYLEPRSFKNLLNSNIGTIEVADIDTIFHFAACSSTTETDNSFLVKNNFHFSKKIAEFAINNKIRLIYASSAATYGDGSNGFSDDEEKLDILRPLNMYGYSKHMFDLWLRNNGLFDAEVVGLKYFNVYGPNERHKGDMRSKILKAYDEIKEYSKISLFRSHRNDYKDGQQLRDFIYIKDAVNMTLFFYDNPGLKGIYNIGTENPRTWNELATLMFNVMGRRNKVEYIPMPEEIKKNYQYFTKADITKLRRAGYEDGMRDLEMGIKDYVRNYLKK